MPTVGELKAQLVAKGYVATNATPEQQAIAGNITVYTHPLITNPVVVIGTDADAAREYQVQLIDEAVKRR